MKIDSGVYTSSSGKQQNIEDMPYPYLVNAYNKAAREGSVDIAKALKQEIDKRPEEATQK